MGDCGAVGPRAQDSAYSNFHSLANVCFGVAAECVVLDTHESVRPEGVCLSEPLEKTGFTNL
jgi:hypothetical protein